MIKWAHLVIDHCYFFGILIFLMYYLFLLFISYSFGAKMSDLTVALNLFNGTNTLPPQSSCNKKTGLKRKR